MQKWAMDIDAEGCRYLGGPEEGTQIKIYPGKTTEAVYFGVIKYINNRRQAKIHCPSLFMEQFHRELPLPLELGDFVEYSASPGAIRLISR